MGSVLFLASWAVLMGPLTYAKHLLSTPRLPFTAAYFGSIALTLYFAVGVSSSFSLITFPSPPLSVLVSFRFKMKILKLTDLTRHQLHSTLLTLISSIAQLAALLWYLVSYFPMGGTGLRFAARFGTNRVAAWMTD